MSNKSKNKFRLSHSYLLPCVCQVMLVFYGLASFSILTPWSRGFLEKIIFFNVFWDIGLLHAFTASPWTLKSWHFLHFTLLGWPNSKNDSSMILQNVGNYVPVYMV